MICHSSILLQKPAGSLPALNPEQQISLFLLHGMVYNGKTGSCLHCCNATSVSANLTQLMQMLYTCQEALRTNTGSRFQEAGLTLQSKGLQHQKLLSPISACENDCTNARCPAGCCFATDLSVPACSYRMFVSHYQGTQAAQKGHSLSCRHPCLGCLHMYTSCGAKGHCCRC